MDRSIDLAVQRIELLGQLKSCCPMTSTKFLQHHIKKKFMPHHINDNKNYAPSHQKKNLLPYCCLQGHSAAFIFSALFASALPMGAHQYNSFNLFLQHTVATSAGMVLIARIEYKGMDTRFLSLRKHWSIDWSGHVMVTSGWHKLAGFRRAQNISSELS